MCGEVLRPFRPRPVREVRRRADHDHAHLGSDRNGDHVFRDLLTKANTCIVPLGNDVGQAVIDDYLDDDIGISGQEALQGGPENRDSGVLACCNTNRACWLIP
jgi:hypothetical protein